jgi:hypothetical protein
MKRKVDQIRDAWNAGDQIIDTIRATVNEAGKAVNVAKLKFKIGGRTITGSFDPCISGSLDQEQSGAKNRIKSGRVRTPV